MTTGSKMLSIVLPCYNEGPTLHELVEDYRNTFRKVEGVELILVNNGSTDETAQRLEEEKKRENPFALKIVTVEKNIGYGHGILRGLAQASGEFLAWSHSDLQCPSRDVLRLYQKILAQSDPQKCFGKGVRINPRHGVIFTRIQTALSALILGYQLSEINAQPKCFHRHFFAQFRRPPAGFELDIYAFYKARKKKLSIVTVEVNFLERKAGQSRWAYSFYSRLKFMANNFIYLWKLRLLANRI